MAVTAERVTRDEVLKRLEQPERRIEGPLKVTGGARYAADLQLPGMLTVRFLRSPYAHARITRLDTSAARAIPGVHAVLTGDDVRGHRFGRRLQDYPVLAWERVRFIGEHVAAVAAESREIAEQALAAIDVAYEELPAVLTPEQALAADAPVLHPDEGAYLYIGGNRPARPHPNMQGYAVVRKDDADLEAAFASCARVFEHTFTTPRHHQGYIEPHACAAWVDEQGRTHIVTTNKAPFTFRGQIATAVGAPPEELVVEAPFIGGDFGGKGTSFDEYACYFLARATGRPVKTVMTYLEELQAGAPRNASHLWLRTGVDADGRIVAHESVLTFNGGAYAAGKPGPGLVPSGNSTPLDLYRVPHARVVSRCVYTNNMPGGNMRAPGEVQLLFAGESHVEMMARELGLDPLEFRRRNALRPGDTLVNGGKVREVRMLEVLDQVERSGWQAPLLPNRGRGVGLSLRHVGGGATNVSLSLRPDGMVEALTGAPDQGNGTATAIQRLVSIELGVPESRVLVRYGDTATAEEDPGVGGSRTAHIVGRAAQAGAVALRDRLEELAAEVLGWPSDAVQLVDDQFVLRGGEERRSFQEVAEHIARGAAVRVNGHYTEEHHAEGGDYQFSATMIEVEVDAETGAVTVTDALLVADVGTILNPTAHRGQLVGGFMTGLGAALMEDLAVVDGRSATPSLGEYKLPTQADAPPLRVVLCPTEVGSGPYGAKMAGELTNTSVAPALANAVAAAIGARVTELPVTAERVRAAMQE
jgi:CO/xanthine dehydrogenase Mo-binding subunit